MLAAVVILPLAAQELPKSVTVFSNLRNPGVGLVPRISGESAEMKRALARAADIMTTFAAPASG